jgi:predicted ribosome quality control (RQC) complex YloA/Tae2 family protein
MPLDGITAHFLSLELDLALRGARAEKFYQPDKYDLCIHIRTKSGHTHLLLSANPDFPRIHLTESTKDNPAIPPSFCMLLRKYLSGGRITAVTAPPYERIIEIHISAINELQDLTDYRLIIEMMGRYSNIVLVNNQNKILDSIMHVDSKMSRVREVMPARTYDYPPGQGKLLPEDAIRMIEGGKPPILESSYGRPIDKAILESLQGFSPLLAKEICHLASVDPRKGFRQLTTSEIQSICTSSLHLLTRIEKSDLLPSLYYSTSKDTPSDFHVLKLEDAGKLITVNSISDAIDTLHSETIRKSNFEQLQKPLVLFAQNALTHAVRKMNVHESDIHDSSDYLLLKKFADTIMIHQNDISSETEVFHADDYENPGTTLKIPLNSNRSPSENAQAYYKRYRKARSKMDAASSFLKEDILAVEYFKSLHQAALSAIDQEDINAIRAEIDSLNMSDSKSGRSESSSGTSKSSPNFPGKSKTGKQRSRALRSAGQAAKRKDNSAQTPDSKRTSSDPTAIFRRYKADDGMVILCGRNNIQNDNLTFKTASPDDLWFHVKNAPGTHVVLRCFGKTPSDKSVLSAAGVAAYYSSSLSVFRRNSSPAIIQDATNPQDHNIRVDVDYCAVRHVKKIPKAKPGMVIYDTYKTLSVPASLPEKLP